jgi:hypothetical protein
MKSYAVLIFSICAALRVAAQDSTRVRYSEETDTLTAQRFVDRYENIFMNKVPTRHMAKVGLQIVPGSATGFENDIVYNLNFSAGYEYKISPAVSAGANFSANGAALSFGRLLVANIYGRWYFEMNRKIARDKGANNFNGRYLSPIYERNWRTTYGTHQMTRIGVELGMQRRFLNYGYIDFAVGGFYQKYSGGYLMNSFVAENRKIEDFTISTRTNLGLAFGDWKRSRNLPVCEILRCDEFLGSQLKLLWPSLALGTRMQRGSFGIGYEVKVGKSPVSVNANFSGDFQFISTKLLPKSGSYSNRYFQIQPSVQVRYYYLQRKKIRTGQGGNNLSGIYAGPYADYIRYNSFFEPYAPIRQHLGPGATFGYQKTFFRNVYFDVSSAMSWNLLKRQQYMSLAMTTIKMGFGFAF